MMELIAYTHCDYTGWFIYILDFSYFQRDQLCTLEVVHQHGVNLEFLNR